MSYLVISNPYYNIYSAFSSFFSSVFSSGTTTGWAWCIANSWVISNLGLLMDLTFLIKKFWTGNIFLHLAVISDVKAESLIKEATKSLRVAFLTCLANVVVMIFLICLIWLCWAYEVALCCLAAFLVEVIQKSLSKKPSEVLASTKHSIKVCHFFIKEHKWSLVVSNP